MFWKLKLLPHIREVYRGLSSNDDDLLLKALESSPLRVTVDGDVVGWDEIVPVLRGLRDSMEHDIVRATSNASDLLRQKDDGAEDLLTTSKLSIARKFYRPVHLFGAMDKSVRALEPLVKDEIRNTDLYS